jgi:hypothetical protein
VGGPSGQHQDKCSSNNIITKMSLWTEEFVSKVHVRDPRVRKTSSCREDIVVSRRHPRVEKTLLCEEGSSRRRVSLGPRLSYNLEINSKFNSENNKFLILRS